MSKNRPSETVLRRAIKILEDIEPDERTVSDYARGTGDGRGYQYKYCNYCHQSWRIVGENYVGILESTNETETPVTGHTEDCLYARARAFIDDYYGDNL